MAAIFIAEDVLGASAVCDPPWVAGRSAAVVARPPNGGLHAVGVAIAVVVQFARRGSAKIARPRFGRPAAGVAHRVACPPLEPAVDALPAPRKGPTFGAAFGAAVVAWHGQHPWPLRCRVPACIAGGRVAGVTCPRLDLRAADIAYPRFDPAVDAETTEASAANARGVRGFPAGIATAARHGLLRLLFGLAPRLHAAPN